MKSNTMKRTWTMTIAIAAFAALPAMSQQMRAKIPFDFSAGSKHMAAGDYTLTKMSASDSTYRLWVHNVVTKDSALLFAAASVDNQAWNASAGKVVFDCNSGACAIVEVHAPGERVAQAFRGLKKKSNEEPFRVSLKLVSGGAASGY